MEANDVVICVDTGGVPTLTLGRLYDARIYNYQKVVNRQVDNPYIGVIDDAGEYRNFKGKRFMLLSEYPYLRHVDFGTIIKELNDIGI